MSLQSTIEKIRANLPKRSSRVLVMFRFEERTVGATGDSIASAAKNAVEVCESKGLDVTKSKGSYIKELAQ